MNESGWMIAAAFDRLPEYLGQHVFLSVSAIAIGFAISLPLAIAAWRWRWLRGPALGIASVIQTIPGLALLALFYPLLLAVSTFTQAFGLGFRALGFLPALLALTLYSMLPVLRNTVTGLAGIDPAIRMAARGVGMTQTQSLTMVELPLAAPVIMAGLRTSAVWVIGAATLSTPVGQTSLGNYIFTGLQTENWVFVLFGCVAAALLALVVDRLLALAETGLAQRSRARLIVAAVGLIAVIGASIAPLFGGAEQTVTIGADDVDVYVDYSGTLWTTAMKRADLPGRQAVLDRLSGWLGKRGVRYAGTLGFENAYAFAMRSDRAKALDIETLADLAAYAPRLKIGGDYEFFSRPEWNATAKAYGLHFALQQQYQANFMYKALVDGDVDVISAFSSDGRIAQFGLKLIADPKHALPPYDAVLLMSSKHANDEKFHSALKPLLGAIDLASMQRANLMVDRPDDKRTPEQAAHWLEQKLKR